VRENQRVEEGPSALGNSDQDQDLRWEVVACTSNVSGLSPIVRFRLHFPHLTAPRADKAVSPYSLGQPSAKGTQPI
jgi:hypothetical protein